MDFLFSVTQDSTQLIKKQVNFHESSEAVDCRCFSEYVFVEILQVLQENTCLESMKFLHMKFQYEISSDQFVVKLETFNLKIYKETDPSLIFFHHFADVLTILGKPWI